MKTIEEVRDSLVEIVNRHHAGCNDPACAEPANMLAFLIHCAGLTDADFAIIRQHLHEYEATCVGCAHRRN